ncbi:tripartite tricarboxylate transporter substrate-binding protein [Enterovirga sp.]|jgi:tripartite-type tricarboxylate transporter receptor subunit TctC|uniref:Bug family tripartite tricarboxylate transporter substrate binding protein n=1 Tax=Enterovirga sp. TaxID=2026350 RepID=UPI002622819A|nr:tripartite tricarboxylate transporter substrate-binding protein [Enterovirga sp.]MDB5590676.1 tripartite tricarboxylate transporter family receptor [Enterovirga sp.]
MRDVTRRGVLAGALAVPALGSGSRAQEPWPAGAGIVRLIVPFPAGGSVDAVARLVQPGLQQRLGATVLVENQPGSSGSAATGRVAKGTPDGSTWVFVFDTHAVNPFMQQLPFDTARDLEPVMLIGTAPNVLATHPSKPYRTAADVIAAAKAKPDGITYATIGTGSLGHLTMVRFARQAGVKLTHVPYRGGGPAMNDALAGHVELIIGSAALINPQLEGKALRPVVQFGATRVASANLKDVPTAGESGMPGLESVAWWGVFAPGKTPPAMIERFNRDLKASLADERANRVLKDSQQIEIRAGAPAELQRFLENEMKVWGAVVRDNNIKADS